MNFSDEWWSQTENVLKNIYNGITADDKEMEDTIIYNRDILETFKKRIAINLLEAKFDSYSNSVVYEFKTNNLDAFTQNRVNIDFNSEILIIIKSAVIKEVSYSDICDCYFIVLKDDTVEKQFYSAAQCKRKKNMNIKFCLVNNKPVPVKTNRPENNNEDY
jgi:hypothetical protein